ncbi:carboxylating nicotinate-nucleotide diphosphorylase [Halalkalibacter urbisdiaboli]|uniref:carboxylating nicotinate-nucleotide diphosphorylase n=1 Tax=Halalkalibacter urbisdiaboli TaxID=1960589 RepID=UPI000B441D5D|nr:carboxylating nicotinate-nucleotide diphosphorylase [Halalkalibacter urbisdiaboli]
MNPLLIKEKLQQFFIEDIGEGDLTTEAIFSNEEGVAIILAKDDGIMAGRSIIELGYEVIDKKVEVNVFIQDGQSFNKGEQIAVIKGPVKSLLTGERVVLNVVQRMSGIATTTFKAVKALNDPTIRICDTRKTTPGLRMFEKYAVRCGGGFNHRKSLDHAVMIKENHIAASGGIEKAVQKVKQQVGHMVNVEVETTNEEEVIEAVRARADVIMFDNCPPEEIKRLSQLVPDSIVTEASGGINLNTISSFKGCGVNYISLGFLTHSVQSVDLSMLLRKGKQS